MLYLIKYIPKPKKKNPVTQLGGFISGGLMKLRCQVVLQSSEGLPGAGGPSPLMEGPHE